MPTRSNPDLKQGNQYRSQLLALAKYTGEGLDKFVKDGKITPEEAKIAKEKARKSIRLRVPADLKAKAEAYVKQHSEYKSMNDFICKIMAEKINQDKKEKSQL